MTSEEIMVMAELDRFIMLSKDPTEILCHRFTQLIFERADAERLFAQLATPQRSIRYAKVCADFELVRKVMRIALGVPPQHA